MSSSWLKEYVLEELGLEIRKASPRENENETATVVATTRAAAAAAAMERTSTTSQARLVQILGRGRGLESDTDATQGKPLPPGNDWWNIKSRGKSPNLAMHTNAWILVSDGSHSVRLYLTIGALKEIFDWDNQNNNEDNLFGPGCCVLLKKYSFECDVDNDNNTCVQLKVSSLEPKPGFNYHHGTINHEDNSSKAINRPVMEETDVLYGLQFLAVQRQEQMTNISSGTNNDSNKSFARDWDIAFGRLSKGRLTVSTTITTTSDEKAEAAVDRNRGLADVLELAEEAALTDEAIREWEMAKKEYGISSTSPMNSANNDSNVDDTQKPMATTTTTKRSDRQDEDHEDNDEDEEGEDLSRMYIQNVLATSDEGEGESENENEKILTSQKEYEADEDGNLSSDSEESLEPLLPETQPKITTLIQPAEDEEKESGEDMVETAKKMSHKRPRGNSFESGTASNLTLDEAITGSGSTKKPGSQMRRRRKQEQLPLHRQQEHPHNSTGIWESIKEQLFEPDRTILYCVPYCRIPSSSNDINEDEKMLVTPKRSLTSKMFGSAASIGTNVTASTPNPSSGAYYRKHGLARWLSQNAIDEERG